MVMMMTPTRNDPPVSLDSDDRKELKQIIIEFLSKNDWLYEKRIQKLIFTAEVYTAQEAGQRLTDATFMPYNYGPYSFVVNQCLDELESNNQISSEESWYITDLDEGDLSPKKKYLIDQISEKTKGMTTDELVARSKDTWLWQNFDHGEEMDFAAYIDEIVPPTHICRTLDRDPVENPDLERLLS